MSVKGSVLILLSLIVLGGALPNCHDARPASLTPNLLQRCDKALSCNICERNPEGLDWLCCEDASGWKSAHIVTPLWFYLHFQNAEWTMLLVVIGKIMESAPLAFSGGNMVFIPTDMANFGTLNGAIIGDILIQGNLAIFIGWMICYIFDFPILVSTWYRANLFNKQYIRNWYMIAMTIVLLTFLFIPITNAADTIRYGLYINAATQVLALWVVFPFFVFNGESADELIWKLDPTDSESIIYPKGKRYIWFFCTGAIILALHMANGGWQFLPNDWFQIWLIAVPILATLTLVAIAVGYQRYDYYMAVIWGIIFLFAASVGFWMTGILFTNQVLTWVGVGLFGVEVLALLLNEIYQTRAQPWNVNWVRRMESNGKNLVQTLKEVRDKNKGE